MKELKDRDNLDLFELVCELSGCYALWNTETLHDAFFEARNELEKRIKVLEKERNELKEENGRIEILLITTNKEKLTCEKMLKKWQTQ